MNDSHRRSIPTPQKKTTDVAEVIWGEVKGTYQTQAISDQSHRQPKTNVALPSDECVKENKDWVDFNEK